MTVGVLTGTVQQTLPRGHPDDTPVVKSARMTPDGEDLLVAIKSVPSWLANVAIQEALMLQVRILYTTPCAE